jgi:hypothetical protein
MHVQINIVIKYHSQVIRCKGGSQLHSRGGEFNNWLSQVDVIMRFWSCIAVRGRDSMQLNFHFLAGGEGCSVFFPLFCIAKWICAILTCAIEATRVMPTLPTGVDNFSRPSTANHEYFQPLDCLYSRVPDKCGVYVRMWQCVCVCIYSAGTDSVYFTVNSCKKAIVMHTCTRSNRANIKSSFEV